jgi:phenylalanyl-tRNA synthetase beta chain
MLYPVSWLKEFVDFDVKIDELAELLTLAGLEVEGIRCVGLPLPGAARGGHASRDRSVGTNVSGLAWDRDKFVVGAVLEIMPHPSADRLVLCRLDDGGAEHTVLTGAPNLLPFKGTGALAEPLKVAYAREGARLYDGHKAGWEVMTLKRTKIRGVESASMACSEKELGISDDHEGVILLDADAPTGMPLVEYMGDAVLDINVMPNMARNANMLGAAREIAALTGASLREPSYEVLWAGKPIEGRAAISIERPELNPRFVLGLIEGVTVKPSPYRIQRRLRLAGMRPINNIVDATNYAMLEIGEPLHAFDYDVLVRRAGGKPPHILTRLPRPIERLTTLDGVDRHLDDFTVLVCDESGALSIGGVMGGAETEIGEQTTHILLEGAAWNLINIRQTLAAQKLTSEAAYRFSRGVHPAMAERGVRRGLALMHELGGGMVAEGLLDAYPLHPRQSVVTLTSADVERSLGMRLEPATFGDILRRLQFTVEVQEDAVRAIAPDHRLDIGEGSVGKADLIEEIARVHGYARIPETQMADRLPAQRNNPSLDGEEQVRDLLAGLGLQEVVTYRMTSPERERRLLPVRAQSGMPPGIQVANPISSERTVMRQSLLASVLEVVEKNARVRERIAVFEIGPVFLDGEDLLPEEPRRLAIAMSGPRTLTDWAQGNPRELDFFDLKGVVEELLSGLHMAPPTFVPSEHPGFHPGKAAQIQLGGRSLGVMGEIHPLVREHYDLPESMVVATELDLDAILATAPDRHMAEPVPGFPPVLEDLAIVVDEAEPAQRVADMIRESGGRLLVGLRLFDVYRGDQIGPGKKSLAYALTYQASDRTLTDDEVARIRAKIVEHLAKTLDAHLRA